MKPRHKLNRRSFVGQVIGGAAFGGALAVLGGRAQAQHQLPTGVTDQDSGSHSDNACYGRGGPGSQPCGSAVEQEGAGNPRHPTGVTDRDSGSNSDNAGYGRGGSGSFRQTGYTDGDPTDPSGGGRGGYNSGYRTGTDSDTGSNSDNYGQGSGGQHAVSDNDPTDPVGRGRNVREGRVGCTDSDVGTSRDPVGHGRRC